MTWEVRQGHVLDVLRAMPGESVQCVVTSPPYWGLRDYGLEPQVWGGDPVCEHEWASESVPTEVGGGNWSQGTNGRGELQPGGIDAKREPIRSEAMRAFCSRCPAWRGSLGLEPTPGLYVEHIVQVFREVRRVLRKDGTLWLNMGDSYAARSGQGPKPSGYERIGRNKRVPRGEGRWGGGSRWAEGLKPKDLIGTPWQVAFALQADGWWLRCDIVWSKQNPMPESVSDRPTRAHEYVFLLSRSARYFYDPEAVREPVSPNTHARLSQDVAAQVGSARANGGSRPTRPMKASGRAPGVNPKAAENGRDSGIKQNADYSEAMSLMVARRNLRSVWSIGTERFSGAHFATFPRALVEPCILAGSPRGGAVLDPFAGSGTTGVVALQLERSFIGIELSPVYAEMAERRIHSQAGLFSVQESAP